MYKKGFVKKLNTYEENDKIGISAIVESSNYDQFYDVCLEYDAKLEEFTKMRCNCFAFSEYAGFCKHCVAAVIALNKKLEPNLRSISHEKEAHATSKALEQFLYGKPKKLLLKYQTLNQPITQKPVELFPILSCGYQDKWSVSFRIGTAVQHYVLKDLSTFVLAVKETQVVYYGKKLSFVHSRSAFAGRVCLCWISL